LAVLETMSGGHAGCEGEGPERPATTDIIPALKPIGVTKAAKAAAVASTHRDEAAKWKAVVERLEADVAHLRGALDAKTLRIRTLDDHVVFWKSQAQESCPSCTGAAATDATVRKGSYSSNSTGQSSRSPPHRGNSNSARGRSQSHARLTGGSGGGRGGGGGSKIRTKARRPQGAAGAGPTRRVNSVVALPTIAR
jgi:uncharacterized membrane protein YgcG